MIFSVGILYSAQMLIDLIEKTSINVNEFNKLFKIFKVADAQYVLNTSLRCDWISFDKNNNLVITDIGKEILDREFIQEKLRIQLLSLIEIERPNWSALICYGREEVIGFIPSEIKQCFVEAGLFDEEYTYDIVQWWDKAAALIRGKNEDINLSVGRYGEKLSLSYEEKRTGIKPIWKSIETNLCGYDILSQISLNNKNRLKIEVKATTSAGNPEFYLTKNEWEVANSSQNYELHLWVIKPKISLYIFKIEDLKNNIPLDSGNGEWQNVKIHFLKEDIESNKMIIDKFSIFEK